MKSKTLLILALLVGVAILASTLLNRQPDIGDDAAITFAASFYRAIGFGRTIQEAFDQGRTALMLEGIPEERTPRAGVPLVPPPPP